MINIMGKRLKKHLPWILFLWLPTVVLLAFADSEAIMLILFGCGYRKCGETIVFSEDKSASSRAEAQKVGIFKAKNKPFLLLGPYTFAPDNRDFLFINKKQVVTTATDKGGGAFFRFGSRLFVIDDLSGSYLNRVRTSTWNALANENSSVVQEDGRYVYSFFLDDDRQVTVAVPAVLLTPDMDEAESFTR